jgi:hypothetical protein
MQSISIPNQLKLNLQMLPYLIEQHANGQSSLDEIASSYRADDHQTTFKNIEDVKALKAVLLWN